MGHKVKRPEPEVKFAWLPSKGFNFRRATKHSYVFSENRILPSPEIGKPPINGIAHYFKCDETGTMRAWGFDETPTNFFKIKDN